MLTGFAIHLENSHNWWNA